MERQAQTKSEHLSGEVLADVFDQLELPPAETVSLRIVREQPVANQDEAYARRSPYPNFRR